MNIFNFFKVILKLIILVGVFYLIVMFFSSENHVDNSRQILNSVHAAISDIHPGVVVSQDPDFEYWFKEGYLQSLKMTEQATSSHLEVMPALFYVKGFQDVHVNLMQRSTLKNIKRNLMNPPLWAGWATQMRGDSVIVADVPESWNSKRNQLNLPDSGSEIISCDGLPVKEYIKNYILPFIDARADVHVAWSQSAPYISMADGMTRFFLSRPDECLVRSPGGESRSIKLQWSPFEGDAREFRRLFFTEANWPEGLKDEYAWKFLSPEVLWVKVGTLRSSGELIEKLDKLCDQLRLLEAKKIVIDLRGNGGGNSLNGTKVLQALYDKSYYLAHIKHYLDRSGYDGSTRYWRVSERALHLTRKKFDSVRSNGQSYFDNLYLNLVLANKQGSEIYAEHIAPGTNDIKNIYEQASYGLNKGKLYVVTDSKCASSCITLLNEAKEILEAVHLGEQANPGTKFNEVVEIKLGDYSLILPTRYDPNKESNRAQKVDIPFNGDINDTQSLQNWVRQIVGVQ